MSYKVHIYYYLVHIFHYILNKEWSQLVQILHNPSVEQYKRDHQFEESNQNHMKYTSRDESKQCNFELSKVRIDLRLSSKTKEGCSHSCMLKELFLSRYSLILVSNLNHTRPQSIDFHRRMLQLSIWFHRHKLHNIFHQGFLFLKNMNHIPLQNWHCHSYMSGKESLYLSKQNKSLAKD